VSDTGGHRGRYDFVGQGLSLAFEFVGAVFLFWFAGRLLDNWLGIDPWGQVAGAVIGWIGGTLHVYYAVQRRQGD
jgi:F0F1-type ATP synthase assembly protein I